jgi:hypothetical protein
VGIRASERPQTVIKVTWLEATVIVAYRRRSPLCRRLSLLLCERRQRHRREDRQ